MELPALIDALQRLVWQLENERSLFEPNQLRQRLEALDCLDSYFPDPYFPGTEQSCAEPDETALYRRAQAIRARLETANSDLYQAIRSEIQRGAGPATLLRWVHMEEAAGPANGMGYDYLDELISCVLQFEEPDTG